MRKYLLAAAALLALSIGVLVLEPAQELLSAPKTYAPAVKPPNTAPVASDPAQVVAMSPNANVAKETGGNLATMAAGLGPLAQMTFVPGNTAPIASLGALVVTMSPNANPAKETGGNLATIAAGIGPLANMVFKPGNTPPAATDPALVITNSPNANVAKETGGNLATMAAGIGPLANMVFKPASTPPATADPALVVAMSPNANVSVETGGNLAAINTATGTQADAAWTGTGNASVISALKGIYVHGAGGGGGGGSVTQGTVPWVDSITQWNNVALGSPTTWGSAPAGAVVIGANTNVLASVLPTNAAVETGGNLATIAAGLAPLGQQTMANSPSVNIASDQSAVAVKVTGQTTGGNSTSGAIAPNNTTAVVVKSSAGTLYGVQVYGIGSVPAYLKIYNATSATCGSGTPVKRLMIPAAATAANGGGSNVSFGSTGVAFSTGITYCVTTGITDADTTAPAASTYLVNLDWQ